MHFVAKVKSGRIKMPKIEGSRYVEVKIEPIHIDPSIVANLPDIFKV